MIEVLKKNQINLDSKDNYCTCFHVFPGSTDNALYSIYIIFYCNFYKGGEGFHAKRNLDNLMIYFTKLMEDSVLPCIK